MNTAQILFALIKRELLEHNSIVRVPLALLFMALLIKLSMVFGGLSVDLELPTQFGLDPLIDGSINAVLLRGASIMNYIIIVVMYVVSVFYSLSCLHHERQDQSVLFWRSLPLSDSVTVASKLSVALILIPLIIIVCQLIVAFIFLLDDSIHYLTQYYGATLAALPKLILWSLLPAVTWCMLCSAIAKRNPFLLAFLSPLLLIVVDYLFFDAAIDQTLAINRLVGVQSDSFGLLLWGIVFSIGFVGITIMKRSERI